MIVDIKKVIAGAVSGAVAAFVVDINAWSRTTDEDGNKEPFSWKLAAKRWVAGAVSGAAAAIGVAQV